MDAVSHLFGVAHPVLERWIAVVFWRAASDYVISVTDELKLRAILSLAKHPFEF